VARLTQDQVVAGLVQRGVPAHVAQGVAANFRDESGFNTGIQELNPHSGRGGYGLAQWTGPRRVALENFAASRGAPSDDPEVQMDFFMQENAGPEAGAWQKVLASPDASSAASAFVNEWERPAAQHAAARTAKYQGGIAVGDPNPNRTTPYTGPAEVGGGSGSDYYSQMAAALAARGQEKQPQNWLEVAGNAMAGANFNPGIKPSLPKGPTEAARIDAPEVQPVVAPAGDRRGQLAEIMARLNSGRLYT